MTELSPEAKKAIETVEKLLRLAAKNPNEQEASSAANKAMELLARHNLDMSAVERNSGDTGKREDDRQRGGLYQWQRDLWKAVAGLNFCMHWTMYTWDKTKIGRRRDRWSGKTVKREGGWRFEHRIVGRKVNVVATRVMSQYLEQAIERLTRERYPDPTQFFIREAVAFREGIADRVIERVFDRRKAMYHEEERKAREAAKRAAEAGGDGVSTATAITLSSMRKSEHDANIDFLYGEGTSAQWETDRIEAAKEREAAEAEYTRWAKANPDEAKKEEERRHKENRRYWSRGRQETGRERRQSSGSYHEGRVKGDKLSIDQQTSQRASAGALT